MLLVRLVLGKLSEIPFKLANLHHQIFCSLTQVLSLSQYWSSSSDSKGDDTVVVVCQTKTIENFENVHHEVSLKLNPPPGPFSRARISAQKTVLIARTRRKIKEILEQTYKRDKIKTWFCSVWGRKRSRHDPVNKMSQ